jgi:hypothetical protein
VVSEISFFVNLCKCQKLIGNVRKLIFFVKNRFVFGEVDQNENRSYNLRFTLRDFLFYKPLNEKRTVNGRQADL